MGIAVFSTCKMDGFLWVTQRSGKVSWAQVGKKTGLSRVWSPDVVFCVAGRSATDVLPDVVHGALFPIVSPRTRECLPDNCQYGALTIVDADGVVLTDEYALAVPGNKQGLVSWESSTKVMDGKAIASAGPLHIQSRFMHSEFTRIELIPTVVVASAATVEKLLAAKLTGLHLIDPVDFRYVRPVPSAVFKKALSAAKKLAKSLGAEAAQEMELEGEYHPDEIVCLGEQWWYNHGVPGMEADEVDHGMHFVDAQSAFVKGFVAAAKKRIKAQR